jgi:hypothetical protein
MNVFKVLDLLNTHFETSINESDLSNPTRDEKKLASRLISIIENAISNNLDEVEEEEVLEIDDGCLDWDMIFDEEDMACRNFIHEDKYNFEQMKQIVKLFEDNPKWKFASFKRRYRKLEGMREIRRYQDYVQKGGKNSQKFAEVGKLTLKHFNEARQMLLPIHDEDIKRWALDYARKLKLSTNEFKASDFWIRNFKKKSRISSRKITKFVTRSQFIDKEKIENDAVEFLLKSRDDFMNIPEHLIINSDQSGFNYELYIPRTLSFVGEKKTFCLNQNSIAITSSYTIMPCLQADGVFLPKMLLVLKEINGEFGPIVSKQVKSLQLKCPNLHIIASSSGKMESKHMEIFKQEILQYCFNENQKFVFIHDGWKGQTQQNLFSDMPNLNRYIIPNNCTDKCQPLDIIGFRQMKIFGKKFYLRVILDQLKIDLRTRRSIIMFQSLMFNQISSPALRNMHKKSFNQYFIHQTIDYASVNNICFENLPAICQFCEKSAFIKCSYCSVILCFECFYVKFHQHFDSQMNNFNRYMKIKKLKIDY